MRTILCLAILGAVTSVFAGEIEPDVQLLLDLRMINDWGIFDWSKFIEKSKNEIWVIAEITPSQNSGVVASEYTDASGVVDKTKGFGTWYRGTVDVTSVLSREEGFVKEPELLRG